MRPDCFGQRLPCAVLVAAMVMCIAVAGPTYTVSQEFGIDGLGYVLQQDASIRGAGTTITVRLDRLAIPPLSRVQFVRLERCVFYDGSALVLQGPNQAAANPGTNGDVALSVSIQDCTFAQGSAMMLRGALRASVVVLERCTFIGDLYAPSSAIYGLLSTYAQVQQLGPRIVLSGVTLQDKSIVKVVETAFSTPSCGVAILVDSSTPSSGYGLELQGNSALVLERCQAALVASNVAALWYSTAAVASDTSSELQFSACRVTVRGGAEAVGVSLSPPASVGTLEPTIHGLLLLHGNSIHIASTTGVVAGFDLDAVAATASSIVMFLTNTVDSTVVGSSSATCVSEAVDSGLFRFPRTTLYGVLSLVENDVSDADFSGCTSLVAIENSAAAYDMSTSKFYVQCNTYNGAQPWASYPPSGSGVGEAAYTIFEGTCGDACFDGLCASFAMTASSVPCSCQCIGADQYGGLCSPVDVAALLYAFHTATRTATRVLSPSVQAPTLTHTANATETYNVGGDRDSRSKTLSASPSSPETATPTVPKATASVPIKTRSESATPVASTTPSATSGGASASTSLSEAVTYSVRTHSHSSSVSAVPHSLSTSQSRTMPSPSATASVSQAHRSKTQTSSLSVPSPSSDATVSATETATTTVTKTLTRNPTNTSTWVATTTPTASASQQLTSSLSNPVGGARRYVHVNQTADTMTVTITSTLSGSRSQQTASVTDARSHVLAITESHTLSRSPPSPTPSSTPAASLSGGTQSDTAPSPSASGTEPITATATLTLSAEEASASGTSTFDASHSILTLTETMAASKTLSASGMPTLTATESPGFRSNTTSVSVSASSSASPSPTPTETVSPSRTQSKSWGSFTVGTSQSTSITGSTDHSLSVSLHPTASVSFSFGAPTSTTSHSLSTSLSQELATMTDTQKPLKSRTTSLSKEGPSASMTLSDSDEVSMSRSLVGTPSQTSSSSPTDSTQPSTSYSDSRTITETGTVSASEALSSATETRTQTLSRSLGTHSGSRSDEETSTDTQSFSATVDVSYSTTASATESDVFSSSGTGTRTTTVSAECSSSTSNDRRASSTETDTVSFTISTTRTRNRRDNDSVSMTGTVSRVLLSDTASTSTSAFLSETSSPSRSQSPSQSQGTPTGSASPQLTGSMDSASGSRSVSTTAGTPTQTPTPSMSTSPSMEAGSSTPTTSETNTETASITIRRSFSRVLSRSRSISEERTETHSVQPTFTRTFHFPSSNFASTNLFADFQRRASTCVQLLVYVMVPLAVVLLLHLSWSVYLWAKSTHIATDTYRSVSRTRSLMALHTYLSIFYPCHYKCAVLHSLQCIVYIATWTAVLLCLVDQLGTDNDTMRAMCCMITLLVCTVFKPLVNVLGFYFWLDDAEDAADDPTGGAGIFSMDATAEAMATKSRLGNSGGVDGEDDSDGIAFDMDDDEWERYRVDRDMLFRQRLEDDLDIVEEEAVEDDVGVESKGAATHEDDSALVGATAANTDGAPPLGNSPSNDNKKMQKKVRKKHKLDAAAVQQHCGGGAVAADGGGGTGDRNRYGFGELDNFVLFHDDYESFQHRGHQLRLAQFAEDHEGDLHVRVAGEDALDEGDRQGDARRRRPRGGDGASNGSRGSSATLTSSCISIQVDDDDNGDGILPTNLAIGVDRDDDEVSISDPRTLRTLHVPLVVGLVGLLALELWAIAGQYRNRPLVCTSWVFTMWWITWLIDFIIMEPLYLVLVALFRFIVREPHEEDAHGNLRTQTQDGLTKRDLRWWRGNLLHPYNGETRYR